MLIFVRADCSENENRRTKETNSPYTISFETNKCISKINQMNNRYEKYLEKADIERKQPWRQSLEIPSFVVSSELSDQECSHGEYQEPNSPHRVTFEVNTCMEKIQQMNRRYEKYLINNKIERKPTWKRLQVPNLKRYPEKMLARQVRKKSLIEKQKELLSKKANNTIRYSFLSISIALVFFVSTTPNNISNYAYPINQSIFPWYNSKYVSGANFVELLNYASNFFVYCIANTEIRLAARDNIKFCIQCIVSVVWKIWLTCVCRTRS